MTTNTRFAIAVHILTLLATSDDPLASPQLAGSVGANPVTIRKIITTLRDSDLVETVIGSTGGSILAQPADRITLQDVYLCMREEMMFGRFPDKPNPDCFVGRNIQSVLGNVLDDTEQQMIAPLAKTTIADLLGQIKSRETST